MPTKRLQCALKYQSTTGFALFGAHQVDVDKIRSKKKEKKIISLPQNWQMGTQKSGNLQIKRCHM